MPCLSVRPAKCNPYFDVAKCAGYVKCLPIYAASTSDKHESCLIVPCSCLL